jgi:uncharacterized protein (DUF1330 family)
MAAHLIVDVTRIHDPQTYERYKKQVSPGLIAAGGQYLARGGAVDVLEGDWKPSRLILVRFNSAAEARRWWASESYAPLRAMRQASTTCNMLIVEGCSDSEVP